MDNPATVHDVNVLTVVASESYKDFVAALQKDISESLSARPRKANEAYFTGKVLKTADWRRDGHAAAGQADLQVSGEERLHRRRRPHHRRTTTRPRRKATLAALPPNCSPTPTRSSS